MKRHCAAVLVITFLFASTVLADIFECKVKKLDVEEGVLVVTVKEKDREYAIAEQVKVLKTVGMGKKSKEQAVNEGLKAVKGGAAVTVWTEVKEGRETVTQIRLESDAKKK